MKECPACRRCFTDDINNCPDDGDATATTLAGEPVLDGRYQLEMRLGQGGMGAVYKARHIFLKTAHAIKVILPDLVGNDPMLTTRFRQEALAAAAIRHPNVIAVTDYGVVDGRMPFLVMEFVSGPSLHDILVNEGALPTGRAVEIMSAVGAGVAAAHKQKIVHRDLKPLNIMLQQDASVSEGLKVLDFGLAKIKSGELLGSFVQAQTTGLMGSPFYMAPEQWSDEEPDSRADIYSLGVMLYQMLTGQVPFKGSGIPSIMKKHLTQKPAPMSEFGVNVPAAIENVVRHALQKERGKRPATAEIFVEELRAAAASVAAALTATDPTQAQESVVAATPVNIVDFGAGAATISQPTATLHIHTIPARSGVFVNNVPVGATDSAGDLTIRNILQGTHRLMIAREGYAQWDGQVICEEGDFHLDIALETLEEGEEAGRTTSVGVVELRNTQFGAAGNQTNRSGRATIAGAGGDFTQNALNETVIFDNIGKAAAPVTDKREKVVVDFTEPPPARRFSPALLGALIGAVLLAGGAFYAFVIRPANNKSPVAVNPPPNPVNAKKGKQIPIPGGTFKMGRKSGLAQETPEHAVTVQSFVLDETEVTNGEYAEFVQATKYPAPSYFSEGKPPAGQEQWPVCNVNVADAEAFAKWRSQRDGVTYRLPTEEEWEYAARNGEQGTVYPWGNTWIDGYAATKEAKILSLQPVGAYANGQNRWGVMDLLGNVWEWTSSKGSWYPGNAQKIAPGQENWIVTRGGSYQASHDDKLNPVSSCYRNWIDPTLKDLRVGFRLARSGN
jgi:serine/threonine-protein kinase